MSAGRRTVTVGDAPLRVGDVAEVAEGTAVELSAAARHRIGRSRMVIEQKLAAEEPTYGLNRGVGHDKDRKIPAAELANFSLFIVHSHEGGFGPPLPHSVVRAAMLARVGGIAAGGSGASPAMPERLVAMLNAGVTPVVPSISSVGAGDLGQMAAIGLVAIGAGEAELGGKRMGGGVALQRAGIAPLALGPKDGLTLVSANGISVGHAALLAHRALGLADIADLTAALSLEATVGNISVVDAAVGAAKPFAGQVKAAQHIRALLEGSYLHGREFESVQDQLSFRVIPQVHGTFREMLTLATSAVETELNSPGDNPLVSMDGRIVHNGNFEPLVMAVAFDALRIAIAHVGQLSEKRMSHLWTAIFKVPEALDPASPHYGLKLRYPAAARYAELRQLAAPATLDAPILDNGVEDHASGAPLSVSQTKEALDVLEDILAIEVLMARELLSIAKPMPQLGVGTRSLWQDMQDLFDRLRPGEPTADVHSAIRERLALASQATR